MLSAELERLARDRVVVAFVGLAQVRGVGAGQRTAGAHPVYGGTGVEAAGEGDTDALADGKVLQDGGGHGSGVGSWMT